MNEISSIVRLLAALSLTERVLVTEMFGSLDVKKVIGLAAAPSLENLAPFFERTHYAVPANWEKPPEHTSARVRKKTASSCR